MHLENISLSIHMVSFDHNGKPLASYGKHGNAPDEYIYPWDVDVSVEYIYIRCISTEATKI